MACNNSLKNRNYKSSVTTYNNSSQDYVVTGTTLNILGTTALDSGCSIDAQTSAFTINHTGTYRISYDVTSTPTSADVQTIRLYNGTSVLPCAINSMNTAQNNTITQHIETTVYLPVCCAVQPSISCQISGTTGNVTNVCANVTRIA